MDHVGERAELPLEAIERPRFESRERLQGDACLSLAIARFVNDPARPGSKPANDLVAGIAREASGEHPFKNSASQPLGAPRG